MKLLKGLMYTTLILSPAAALSAVYGGSNLGYGGYQSHSCFKPVRPSKPYSLDNQWEISRYNADVDSYNANLNLYFSCIRDYLERAENDIKRIRKKMDEAISDAESPY